MEVSIKKYIVIAVVQILMWFVQLFMINLKCTIVDVQNKFVLGKLHHDILIWIRSSLNRVALHLILLLKQLNVGVFSRNAKLIGQQNHVI